METIKNINDFKKFKDEKKTISMITCYDHAFARLVEQSSIDTILVGDSVGMVIAGENSTLPVTVEQIIYHARIVRKGAPSKFIVADLPFMSYHISIEDTLKNCGKIMKESGANAVKLEGGTEFVDIVRAIVRASIPVVGHLGLTPQSVHKLGGYSVQGRDDEKRTKMIEDALALEKAGVFALVLEMVPEDLAKEISEKLSIPTIGIGAGRYCNGQVLVINDLLGMDERFNPKFLKKYTNFSQTAIEAFNSYDSDVKSRNFPEEKNCFK